MTTEKQRMGMGLCCETFLHERSSSSFLDMEVHMEYRWYKPWDIILNDILQVSSARNELSVAPQFKVAREAFKCISLV